MESQQTQSDIYADQITRHDLGLVKKVCRKGSSSRGLSCISEPPLFDIEGEGVGVEKTPNLKLLRALGFPSVLGAKLIWTASPSMKIVEGRWKQIGAGGFGVIYEATDLHSGKLVAVKVETSVRRNTLEVENNVYNCLSESSRKLVGFAVCIFYGEVSTSKRVLVLQKLGPSLRSILSGTAQGTLPPKTVFALGIQGLKRLQDLHGIGFVHGDVRLENLLMGAQDPLRMYLIDFGIAKRCLGRRMLKIKMLEQKRRHEAMGVRLNDSNRHVAGTKGYDLQRFGYCLVELSTGHLPWTERENSCYHSGEKDDEGILKIGTNPCMKVEKELSRYFEYVRTLHFNEKPNYRYLMSLLRNGITRL